MKIQKKQEIEFFGTKTGNANSIALGYATETKNFGEVAVGVMNKSTAAKDPNSPKGVCADSDATLFSVGCGGSGERKNALEVKGDGSVIISGEGGDINIADEIKKAIGLKQEINLVKSPGDDLNYTLMVDNKAHGSINIPKDQFLKSVSYDDENKQLVFVFVTLDEDEHVERVPVNDLKDIYTAGNGINIDNNVISADFSSVMTAISDEKTQRETTDNEIKSTLGNKLETVVDYTQRLWLCDNISDNGSMVAVTYTDENGVQLDDGVSLVFGNSPEYDYSNIIYNTTISQNGIKFVNGSQWLSIDCNGISKRSGSNKEVFAANGTLYDLTNKADTTELNEVKQDVQSVKDDVEYIKQQSLILDQVSYGIEWDNSTASSDCVRIGNLSMHKSLPIQSQMKGVVHQHGVIQYYLDPNDWSKKADGTPSRLDGYDGEVGVTMPKFYLWSETEGTKRRVRISEIKAVPYAQEMPAHIIGAKKACKLNRVPENMGYLSTLPVNSLVSICNDSDYCCGSQSADNDSFKDTYPERARFGKPISNITRANARSYAKLAGNQLQMYNQYKAMFWLYYIEYANLDCQTEFNAEPTPEGYKRGGLGTGCTNLYNDEWETFNGTNHIFKNDIMNDCGNFTSSKTVTFSSYKFKTRSVNISSYLNNSNATISISNEIATITNTTNNEIFSLKFYNSGTITYTITGATEENPIIFYESSIDSPIATATSDGDITVIWNNNIYAKHIGIKTPGNCNITITIKNSEPAIIDLPERTTYVNSYRGVQEPFGDTWTNIDGIIINKKSDGVNNIYITDDVNFNDNVSNTTLLGEYIATNGYLKDLNIGEHADLIPIIGSYDECKFKDYNYNNNYNYDRLFVVGGDAHYGFESGLGLFDLRLSFSNMRKQVSFRITTAL